MAYILEFLRNSNVRLLMYYPIYVITTFSSCNKDWKMANVTPIFKEGSSGESRNYRPVRLTSVPGKLVENIIKHRIRNIEGGTHNGTKWGN